MFGACLRTAAAAKAKAPPERLKVAEGKEAAARAKEARDASFAICEVACGCGVMVIPCPWAWPVGRVEAQAVPQVWARECSAARKPLLLGFNPAVAGQEGA